MSAGPVPQAPRTPCGHLPLAAQALFDEEWLDVDLDDLTAVARFRDKWWGRAIFETDPTIAADFEKLRRGELELVPSPITR